MMNHSNKNSEAELPVDCLSTYTAPNGLGFFHHSTNETDYVYNEIFVEQVYLQHGVTIQNSDVVFDIGANIGLFMMFLKENYEGVNVYAFEPSPPIFKILQANAERYGKSVHVFAYGIADKRGESLFTYYPNYSIMSGLHANETDDQSVLLSGIKSHLIERNIDPIDVGEKCLQRMVKAALGQKTEYVCQIRTISEVIEEHSINSVGLLKIDAEGSELNILYGIRDEDWPKVRQIVLEIHDPSGITQHKISELLDAKGYETNFAAELRLVGSGIVNCYARKRISIPPSKTSLP
jgi:FkbM family methyltransferase